MLNSLKATQLTNNDVRWTLKQKTLLEIKKKKKKKKK